MSVEMAIRLVLNCRSNELAYILIMRAHNFTSGKDTRVIFPIGMSM